MPETILFVIDSSLELHHETIPSSGSSRLDVLRQLILFYSACKLKTNASTFFAIGHASRVGVELRNVRGEKSRAYTSSTEELATMLTESIAFQQMPCSDEVDPGGGKIFPMESVLAAMASLRHSLAPTGNPLTTCRVIVVWCHSASEPSFTLPPPLLQPFSSHTPSELLSIDCTMDILYLHSRPSSQDQVDRLHSIFSTLTAQANSISSHLFISIPGSSFLSSPPKLFTIDANRGLKRPSSYIFEASLHSPAAIRRVLGAFVQLMAPADLRPAQDDLVSPPTDLTTLPLQQRREVAHSQPPLLAQPPALIPIGSIPVIASASEGSKSESQQISSALGPAGPQTGDLLGDLI